MKYGYTFSQHSRLTSGNKTCVVPPQLQPLPISINSQVWLLSRYTCPLAPIISRHRLTRLRSCWLINESLLLPCQSRCAILSLFKRVLATSAHNILRGREELIKKMNNDTTPSSATSEMHYYTSILDIMGDTPLVRLNRVASDVPPLVLAKMEMFNPGGSVKDRIGPAMIDYCEQH